MRTLEIKACDNTVKKGNVAPILSSIFVKFKLFKDYEEMKIKKCIFLKKSWEVRFWEYYFSFKKEAIVDEEPFYSQRSFYYYYLII